MYKRQNLSREDRSCLGYVMLKDICNGLRTAHGLNPDQTAFMHRDIKVSNIMVEPQTRRLALIDFGTTKIIDRDQDPSTIHSTNVGQCCYRAPECINSKHYDKSCDIWAVGITMIYFLTGEHPITANIPEESSPRTAGNIVNDRIRNPDYEIKLPAGHFEDGLVSIINRCVSREPTVRPTADEICNCLLYTSPSPRD